MDKKNSSNRQLCSAFLYSGLLGEIPLPSRYDFEFKKRNGKRKKEKKPNYYVKSKWMMKMSRDASRGTRYAGLSISFLSPINGHWWVLAIISCSNNESPSNHLLLGSFFRIFTSIQLLLQMMSRKVVLLCQTSSICLLSHTNICYYVMFVTSLDDPKIKDFTL